MSRTKVKTISKELRKFIPTSHAENPALTENAPEIENRPLIFFYKLMTREHRYNLRGLLNISKGFKEDLPTITNVGTAARYVFENCVIMVKNVLLDDEQLESCEGDVKDGLFDSKGMEAEITECIKHIQEESNLDEVEAKN